MLSGRCYERETVPFKAVDPVVDELRHWLSQLPDGEAGRFLPADLSVLARVFPVLGDLEVAGVSSRLKAYPLERALDHIEPHELRRRAFAAMKELLGNIWKAPMLWQSAMVRVFSCYERGLSALSAAAAGHDRKRALDATQRWAKTLMKEKLRYAPALGHLLRAGASAVSGERSAALLALEAAIPRLDDADLGYLAACARHRKGELSGGATGRELLERSRAFFLAQGIVNTERCLAMSAPGFT